MANITAKFQVRRDTAANWGAANPTLAPGEIGYETDTRRMKIGNGSDNWSSLLYFAIVYDDTDWTVLTETEGQALVDEIDAILAAIDATSAPLTVSVNAQSGTAYTLVPSDAGKKITMSNAAAQVLTIPASASVAFPVGTIISVAQIGAETTTITAASGVTVNGSAASSHTIEAQYTGATLIKLATDTWLLEGNIAVVA